MKYYPSNNWPTYSLVPPYLSPVSFATFVEANRHDPPPRFDSTTMATVAEADRARILNALRFFGWSDYTDATTEQFKALASLDASAMRGRWRLAIDNSYRFLFEDFKLEQATLSDLVVRFSEQGIRGHTARKAVSFFVGIAKMANPEPPLSPDIKATRPRRPKGERTSKSPVRQGGHNSAPEQAIAGRSIRAGTVAKTIEFRSGGGASLYVSGDVFGLSAADRSALFGWIDAMTNYERESANEA